MIKVLPGKDSGYVVIDTNTHRVLGRHESKRAAIKQRRYLRRKVRA